MANLVWMEAGHRHALCTKNAKCATRAIWISTHINYDGEARCAKHGPKPPAKRKAKFKRWTVYAHGGENIKYSDGKSTVWPTMQEIVDALNAARVTLPTGRKAKP